MPSFVNYIPSIVLCVLAICSLVLKNKARAIARNVLLWTATLMVVGFYSLIVMKPAAIQTVQTSVAAARAEIPLKGQSMMNIAIGKLFQSAWSSKKTDNDRRIIDASTTGMGSVLKLAAKSFDEYLKDSPDKPVTKAKLVMALSMDKKKEQDRERAAKLIKEMEQADSERERDIGKALDVALLGAPASQENVKKHATTLENTFTPGWFRDYALLALYREGDRAQYNKWATHLEDTYANSFYKISFLLALVFLGFWVGLVVLVVQIGSISRKDSRSVDGTKQYGKSLDSTDKAEIPIGLKNVWIVLVAWQATEVVVLSQLLKLLPIGSLKSLGGSSLSMAMFLLITYLINMVPAILYIYFLALKPNGLRFMQALNIRFRTSTAGPLRLLLGGILSWCACIPLVLIASIIASMNGSKGSDNPVLAQMISAMKVADPVVVALMFITIAVLAPLCEEIIFRGFLYGVLRRNCGTFIALLVSSFVFAAIHLDIGAIAPLFCIGLSLALSYERNRSLVPCFVAHGMWNGGQLILQLALFS